MESLSQKPSAKLQSREQQTTKPAANVHSGVNDTKLADTIMAAHGSQQVATGQSDTYESAITQWQVAASAVTNEHTTGILELLSLNAYSVFIGDCRSCKLSKSVMSIHTELLQRTDTFKMQLL